MPGDRPTIQQAIDAAQPGDVIEVAAGTYQKSLRVTKPLTLRAADRTGVVLTAAPEEAAILEVAEGITVHLEGLSFQGGRVGVQLNSRAKAVIRRCAITGQSQAGIVALEDAELALWDNEIASVRVVGLQIAATARVIGGGNSLHDNGTDVDGWLPPGARLGKKPSVTLRTDPSKGLAVTLKLITTESEVKALIHTVNLPEGVPPDLYDVSIQSRGATPDISWGSLDVVGEVVVHVDSGIALDRLLPMPWRVLEAQTGQLITSVSRTRTVPLPPGRYRLVARTGGEGTPFGSPDGVVVPEGRVVVVPADFVTPPSASGPIALDDPDVVALLAQARAAQPACSGPVEASGRLRLGDDLLKVEPEGDAAAWLWRFDDQGSVVRVAAAVQPDGAFRIERVAPGVYFLESQYRNAEGRYYQGVSQTVDVGCKGASGLSQRLEDTGARLPEMPEEPQARFRLRLPALMPEACAAESTGTGGCEPDPNQPPCACGKLRVCVFSGDNRLLVSGGHVLPMLPVKGEISRWTWMGMDMPPTVPFEFEKEFADALGQTSPCYDIVPMDSTFTEVAMKGQEFAALIEQIKAARAAGNTALAEELTAAAKQLLQTNFALGLEVFGQATCPAVVVLGGHGAIPKVTASVQVDGEVALEGSATATGSWASRLAKQVDGQLASMQQKLFGACEEIVTSCTGVDWELAHQTHRCDTARYCNSELMSTSTQHGKYLRAVGLHIERKNVCCSEAAQEAAGNVEGNQEFCPGIGGPLSRDLDCDGLLNSDDPTPLPPEDAEDINRKIDEATGASQ